MAAGGRACLWSSTCSDSGAELLAHVPLMYCSCTAGIFLMFCVCTARVLLAYCSCTACILLVYCLHIAHVLLAYCSCTVCVLLMCILHTAWYKLCVDDVKLSTACELFVSCCSCTARVHSADSLQPARILVLQLPACVLLAYCL